MNDVFSAGKSSGRTISAELPRCMPTGCAFQQVRSGIKGNRICRLLRLVLLEMAGIILSRGPADRTMVLSLREALRYC